MKKVFRIALAGNPNCGKTTVFNALTGTRQHVGNYPGVTVESKTGHFKIGDIKIELVDLPGVYSMSSNSPEEKVAFQELTAGNIDMILDVIDSSLPQRSFYLTTQLAELHLPMVLIFNMSDEAEAKGIKFDIPKLEKYFGSPIVQTVGCRSSGVDELKKVIGKALANLEEHGVPKISYGEDVEESINVLVKELEQLDVAKYRHIPPRFFAIKFLERDASTMALEEFKSIIPLAEAEIRHLSAKHAIAADTFMADRRYAMLAGACRDAISSTGEKRREVSDRIDSFVTNKYIGLPLFFIVIYIMFWLTFTCADPLMGYIESAFGWFGDMIGHLWPETILPFLRSLIIDGIIAGVGGVIVFLPNILFLFLGISFLEDSGYMARAAFVMDGIMRKFGLHGKSFVPLVLGFGCTVPAIMATRSIESEKDRTTTILVLPFFSCGARLPIYALIIPAFFAVKYQALMMWVIYLIGIIVALVAARILKSTLFKGDDEVYLMEFPPYRMPTLKSILLHMWDRGKTYLQKAGTIILAASIVLFILNTYPEKELFSQDYDAQIELLEGQKVLDNEELEAFEKEANLTEAQQAVLAKSTQINAEIEELEFAKQAEAMEYTISGRIGHTAERFFRPLGFDWRVSTALLGALAAKEVFVSQLGILYSVGEADEESMELRAHLRNNYTPLQGFCIMLFCLLSIPCFATLAIIKRELNSWKWMWIEGVALFCVAYFITLVVYQLGSLFQIGTTML